MRRKRSMKYTFESTGTDLATQMNENIVNVLW